MQSSAASNISREDAYQIKLAQTTLFHFRLIIRRSIPTGDPLSAATFPHHKVATLEMAPLRCRAGTPGKFHTENFNSPDATTHLRNKLRRPSATCKTSCRLLQGHDRPASPHRPSYPITAFLKGWRMGPKLNPTLTFESPLAVRASC